MRIAICSVVALHKDEEFGMPLSPPQERELLHGAVAGDAGGAVASDR